FRVDAKPVADIRKPDRVRIDHRAAAPDRPAVAIDPDDVDVPGPVGDALLEDARALVDHRVDHAFDDLLLVDRAPCDPEPARGFDDDRLDLGVGLRRARALFVDIVTLTGLLAEAAGFAEGVGDSGLGATGLADAPADVVAGKVPHGERAHREAELDHDG